MAKLSFSKNENKNYQKAIDLILFVFIVKILVLMDNRKIIFGSPVCTGWTSGEYISVYRGKYGCHCIVPNTISIIEVDCPF